MAKTIEELKQLAIAIRDEKGKARNTASRLGQTFLDHVNKMQEEEANLEEKSNNLQMQIDDIIAQNAKLTISVKPQNFFNDESTKFTIEAILEGAKADITISRERVLLGVTLNTDRAVVTDRNDVNATYTAVAVVNGRTLTESVSTYGCFPIYFGSAKTATEIAGNIAHKVLTPKSNVNGTYQFNTSVGDKIFFIVHDSMSFDLSKVKSEGYTVGMEKSGTTDINGGNFNIYETDPITVGGDVSIEIG